MMPFVVAVVCEALIEYTKTIIKAFSEGDKKTAITQLCAIIIAIVLCFCANADVFAMCGFAFPTPYVGIILTGIFGSRGANYVSDILKKIKEKF